MVFVLPYDLYRRQETIFSTVTFHFIMLVLHN